MAIRRYTRGDHTITPKEYRREYCALICDRSDGDISDYTLEELAEELQSYREEILEADDPVDELEISLVLSAPPEVWYEELKEMAKDKSWYYERYGA